MLSQIPDIMNTVVVNKRYWLRWIICMSFELDCLFDNDFYIDSVFNISILLHHSNNISSYRDSKVYQDSRHVSGVSANTDHHPLSSWSLWTEEKLEGDLDQWPSRDRYHKTFCLKYVELKIWSIFVEWESI